MGEAAQAGGKGPSLEHQGKQYAIAPFDLDMIQMFELWLEERAWAAVERLKHRITEGQYEKRLAVVARQIASLEYSYGSEAYASASQSVEGQKFITFLMLSKLNRGMTQSLAGEIWQQHFLMLQAKMKAMNSDPNTESPAGTLQTETAGETLLEATSTPSPSSTPSSLESPTGSPSTESAA